MATDARSTSRDRLRAMPCQKEENERSEVKSAKTIRMSLFAGTTSDPRFAANDSGPMPEPSNEVPAKSAGVRRLFYECSRSPLKPAF